METVFIIICGLGFGLALYGFVAIVKDICSEDKEFQNYCMRCVHCNQIVGFHCECTIHGSVDDEVRFCSDKDLGDV